jgi:hypothetical protein
METCVLCGKPMHHATKPYWIIDPVSLKVRGKAHTGCRDKLGSSYAIQFSLRATGDAPSREVIAFTKKMIDARASLPPWETEKEFKVMLLLVSYKFEVSSVEELFANPSVMKTIEWWKSPKGHGYSQEDVDEVKNRLKELLE